MNMQDLQQYGAWRARVAASLEAYRNDAQAADLLDAAGEQRLARALARLNRIAVDTHAAAQRLEAELEARAR